MAVFVRGPVLPGGETRDLYVVDGVVTYEPVGGAERLPDGWVVPGLVDAHCHVGMDPRGLSDDRDRLRGQALADRDAGALALRDCGTPVDTRWIDDEPDLPRMIRAGRHVAKPKRYIRDVAVETDDGGLADEVERQARRGDGWVKLVGDWIDRDTGDLAPLWSPDALREAIDRAHSVGGRVTAHVFAEEAVVDLVAAGIDCIEHGTGLSVDTMAVMAERGVALVPTVVNIGNFPSIADSAGRYPTYADHMRSLHATAGERFAAAYEAGVPIYAGTDAGGQLEHGLIGAEVRALRDVGLSAYDALGAASWRAREWLGLRGLEEGDPADFVVYPADPLQDLGVLDHPSYLVLRGRVHRPGGAAA